MRRAAGTGLVVAALLVAGGLVAAFAALGGVDRLRTADTAAAAAAACTAEPSAAQGGAAEAEASTILIAALDDAACSLGVPREDLVLALGRGEGVDGAAQQLGVPPARLQAAVLGSIRETVAAEDAAGRLTPETSLAITTLLDVIPPDQLLAAVRDEQGACAEVPWKQVDGLRAVAAEVGVLTGLRAACALGIAPLEAVAALADPAGLDGLVARSGRSAAEVEAAVRDAMGASIAQAQEAGALTSTEGSVLGAAAKVAPVDRILAIVRGDDDPCAPFPWGEADGQGEVLAEVALIGVVDAACQLQAPTFDVFAALASPEALTALEQSTGKSEGEIDDALKAGLDKAIGVASDAGAMSGLEALLLRAALSQVGVLDLLGRLSG